MTVQTYLFFDGRCEEAIDVYCSALHAVCLFKMRFKDAPPGPTPVLEPEMVFHATLKIGETIVNLADLPPGEGGKFDGFALLLHFETTDDAEAAFSSLAQGGAMRLPIAETSWALRYGIVEDRFGITWKVQVNRDGSS